MSGSHPLPDRVVVVGAGLAGGRTCTALRAAGFAGDVILVGAEDHAPYDRPPLSKSVLTQGADPDLGLDLVGQDVKLQLGVAATGIDLASQVLMTDTGPIPYDALVLATGLQPIRLPGNGPQMTLRTIEDARSLRARLVPGARLAVIGAGWVGAEVTTAALELGCEVTCLDSAAAPLAGPLGARVGAMFLPWWDGVDLRLGTRIREVGARGPVLADGELIAADVVLTAVGVRAQTGWLASAGLEVTDAGVAVGADHRTSDPHVYAVGDIACRWSDRLGRRVHNGHWDEAASGPAAVAASIMGLPPTPDDVPYFWSDQFGRKIQYVGQHDEADVVVVRQHEDADKWAVAWLDSMGRLTAHLSVGFPRSMVQARAAIADGRLVDPDRCRDLSQPL
jgi:Uncharacterized NAD(FAD)-dependent dehydrogenases